VALGKLTGRGEVPSPGEVASPAEAADARAAKSLTHHESSPPLPSRVRTLTAVVVERFAHLREAVA